MLINFYILFGRKGEDLKTGNYQYELKLPDGNVIFGSLDIVKK